jgi:hypothetical protein
MGVHIAGAVAGAPAIAEAKQKRAVRKPLEAATEMKALGLVGA